MKINYTLKILPLFFSALLFAQESLYTSLTISDELKKNANAVLRLDETKMEITSIKSLKRKYKRIITILNKKGNSHLDAYVHYNSNIQVRKLKATVYNKFGSKIKSFNKSDFKDVSAVSNISLYEDSRVKYLDYTPINYPYTVVFYYETTTPNTAWIPFWRPLEGYYISTETSTYTIAYDASVGINIKEKNFTNYSIINNSSDGVLSYTANNIEALKPEALSPSFRVFAPRLLVTPKHFHYEGYTGETGNWESLGKWMYDKLLYGRASVSEATILEIKNRVAGINDPIEKAKKVYDYVQANTRYISVQVGIGGIQPIPAMEVDNVKYGDCKGLTNYTKALLDVVGVESYYTEVYASSKIQYSVDKNFASLLGQGNHVILNIPTQNDESVWLECTSQIMPFGFLGDFTDDRDVFVITPEGGKIQRTPKYATEKNSQTTIAVYSIINDRSIEVETTISSKGIQYDNIYYIKDKEPRELDKHYKTYWSNINNITIKDINFKNDKEEIKFVQSVKFTATDYASDIGDQLIFVPNALNKNTYIPDRYRNRTLPLSILRGFIDEDEYEINLPHNYDIEFIPDNKTIENKFGIYKTEIEVITPNKIKYKRLFTIYDGLYPKDNYAQYRNFLKQVSKQDNAKIVLIKKQ